MRAARAPSTSRLQLPRETTGVRPGFGAVARRSILDQRTEGGRRKGDANRTATPEIGRRTAIPEEDQHNREQETVRCDDARSSE